MVDVIKSVVVKEDEMKCSNCFYGHQIVAGVFGGNTDDDGRQTRWHLTEPIKVGQTRNCLNWFQRKVLEIPKFIYPKENDTCVNPKKFRVNNK